MADSVIYDKAFLHFRGNGNFPNDLPIEQAYVHIGMFLGWMIEKGLYNDFFEDECGVQIIRFKNRKLSCTILSEIWEGFISSEMFTDHGNMFAYYYYGGGIYNKDYEKTLMNDLPSIYHVEDSWENFEKLSAVIEDRYKQWLEMVS